MKNSALLGDSDPEDTNTLPTDTGGDAEGEKDAWKNIGNYTSGMITDEQTIDKFTLQAAARELSDSSALRACLRVPIPGAHTVDIVKRARTDNVFYRNLCTCKLVWLCPICAARISARRTYELIDLLSRTSDHTIIDSIGVRGIVRDLRYNICMATFTVGHKLKDPLARTMRVLKTSYHGMFSGRGAKRFYDAYGIVGGVRAFEVTHGALNGWHPHIHTLFISETPFNAPRASEMFIALAPRWVNEVERAGGYATMDRGVNVMYGDRSLIHYIDKSGQHITRVCLDNSPINEVGRTPAKKGHDGGRTLWQLLADYVRGDIAAGELWIVAQAELKGTRQLLPSNSIRALMIDPDALRDDIAGIDERRADDIILAQLSLDDWRLVHRWGLRGQLLEQARQGGSGAIGVMMDRLRKLSRGVARIPS